MSSATSITHASGSEKTFTSFSLLPPELRAQIWRYALPQLRGPTLYHFHPYLRKVKRLKRSDPRYLRASKRRNNSTNSDTTVPSRPEKLDHPLYLPMALVNSEARHIALSWATKHASRVRQVHGLGFVERFDVAQDSIYIEANSHEFLNWRKAGNFIEPEWTRSRPDFRIRHVAVHQSVLYNQGLDIHGLLQCVGGNGVLYIVCEPQEPQRTSYWMTTGFIEGVLIWEPRVMDCLEIGGPVGGVYRWNCETRQFHFESSDDSSGLDTELPFLKSPWSPRVPQEGLTLRDGLHDMLTSLAAMFTYYGRAVHGFEIRPVQIVHRPT
ncbi:hypothetical protein K461DRAFT_65024 [Myriangium duriaei CBS 260.36]|uniref:2EXR domain-containing protein n=1 Tax=Myriangium duriaei CBS 260.36 TaxID=1168546 RepID=A0A9P4MCS0_9PEZI|nr:hypothetical protein K461DRAFT_65024 [Myriangium duriaei CBS 260.36]